MIDTDTTTKNAEPKTKRKISKAMEWAYAHPFVIEEVTDPELRSQMCCYRNKDKEQQKQEQNETQRYEEAVA